MLNHILILAEHIHVGIWSDVSQSFVANPAPNDILCLQDKAAERRSRKSHWSWDMRSQFQPQSGVPWKTKHSKRRLWEGSSRARKFLRGPWFWMRTKGRWTPGPVLQDPESRFERWDDPTEKERTLDTEEFSLEKSTWTWTSTTSLLLSWKQLASWASLLSPRWT